MSYSMGQWQLSSDDLKRYPHFDALLSVEEANALATDPERVRSHAFFPLLLFREQWWPFGRKSDANPDKKSRKIRYAARGDAYIYSYYRHLPPPFRRGIQGGVPNGTPFRPQNRTALARSPLPTPLPRALSARPSASCENGVSD